MIQRQYPVNGGLTLIRRGPGVSCPAVTPRRVDQAWVVRSASL